MPEVRIGAEDGQGPDVLGRVEAVATLSTGEIAIADSRPMQLKTFDSAGRHLWSAGREGEGPGEFKSIAGLLSKHGDTLLVLDRSPPRAILFDSEGTHIRTSSLHSRDPDRFGPTNYRGSLANGEIVATVPTREGSVVRGGYRRFIHTLTVLDGSGALLRRALPSSAASYIRRECRSRSQTARPWT